MENNQARKKHLVCAILFLKLQNEDFWYANLYFSKTRHHESEADTGWTEGLH